MKRFSLLALALVVAATLFVAADPAGAKAPAKVTGGFSITVGGIDGRFTVNAAEGATNEGSLGTISYSGADGNGFTVNVMFASIEGNQAWVGGPVTSTTWPNINHTYLRMVLTDNATPGANADSFWGVFDAGESTAFDWVMNHGMVYPGNAITVITGGNLTVH